MRAFGAAFLISLLMVTPVVAQQAGELGLPIILQADELIHDNQNGTVIAIGNVRWNVVNVRPVE